MRLLTRIPTLGDFLQANSADRVEANKEVVVVLIFSLMPIWLGMLIVTIVQFSSGVGGFLLDFASSSDIGILSAALLGPVIYMIFKEYAPTGDNKAPSRFPSGLQFIVAIIVCCVIATTIYCFVYVAKSKSFFDAHGTPIWFVNAGAIRLLSCVLFFTSIWLVYSATTIRNSIESRARAVTREMSEDTARFVEEFQKEQDALQQTPEHDPAVPPDVNADALNLAKQLQHGDRPPEAG